MTATPAWCSTASACIRTYQFAFTYVQQCVSMEWNGNKWRGGELLGAATITYARELSPKFTDNPTNPRTKYGNRKHGGG